jgi:DNA-binding transcriptional regulator YiaG
MARISKYINEYSETSETLAKEFYKEALDLTLEQLEALQTKYGISNVVLCDTLKISMTVLSKWKHGERDLADYYKINIYSFFKFLEEKTKR